jgi:outer membrane protein assembly factor BamB
MKTQIHVTIRAHFLRSRVYILFPVVVCAIPFASAQRQAALLPASGGRTASSRAKPTVRPTPTPRPRPTPAPRPGGTAPGDQSVTWQNNAVHDGFDSASRLVTPLTLKWSRDLGASGVTTISYPLIAQGLVIVTTATGNNYGTTLMALDEDTGATIWSVDINGTYYFANAAYDSGKVFVVNFDGLMDAFDAASGTLLWSVSLPGQYAFTSPPTAASGVVFTGGAGSGGTVYGVNEANGAVLWTVPVEDSWHSSPAVVAGEVFVSYPQVYAFSAATGEQLWNYSGGCEVGGGTTPVVHAGQVYVRGCFNTSPNGIVIAADTGTKTGEFDSDRPPAFVGDLGIYLQQGTLRGIDLTTGQVLWSFAGDGSLSSPPLVVNQTIYIGSYSGTLFALNMSGQQIWSTQVGAPIPYPDEWNAWLTTGLGAGDGLLVVPAGSILAAYGN